MEKCTKYSNWKIWKEGDHGKDLGINGRIVLKCILYFMIMRAYRPQWNSFCVCICLRVCVCVVVCVYIRVYRELQVVMPEASL